MERRRISEIGLVRDALHERIARPQRLMLAAAFVDGDEQRDVDHVPHAPDLVLLAMNFRLIGQGGARSSAASRRSACSLGVAPL